MNTATKRAKKHKQRNGHLKRAKLLAVLTIIWNIIEAGFALFFGLAANSPSLTSYGIDAGIETCSAAVMFWRLRAEQKAGSRDGAEGQERFASKLLGVLLLLLCVYICVDSGTALAGIEDPPSVSWPGVIITAVGLVVTPFLAYFKWKSSDHLDSGAQRADTVQTLASCWLGFTAMLGLLANATLGWTWADPLAALLFIPIIVKEGIAAIRN